MRIKEREELLKAYENRYPALDEYFKRQLSEEYDRYYEKLQHMQTEREVEVFFEEEIEKNEQLYKDNAHMKGIESALNDQYMTVLAAYGLIVFFRDNMVEQ